MELSTTSTAGGPAKTASKIQRASDTLAGLAAESSDFLRKNYRVEGRALAAERKYAFYAYGPPAVPLSFAVRAGEIAHHLRSSLDHLVTELAAIGPGGGKPNRLEFPVCSSNELFRKACQYGKIAGVSDNAAQLIEKVQPYHWDPPKQATLMMLQDLDVIDKHRTPLVVACVPKMTKRLEIDGNGHDVVIVGMSPPVSRGARPSPGGTEIFAIEFGESGAHPPRIDGDFPFSLMFDGASLGLSFDLPVIDALQHMRDQVLSLIGLFFMQAPDGALIERNPVATVTKGQPIAFE